MSGSTSSWRCFAGAAALATAMAVSGWSPLAGEEFGAPVLAIIDVQKILRESEAVKALTATIEAERDKYQEELRQK